MAESNATHFGLGAKYVLDQDASISVSTGPLKTKYLIT
jgi:long-subunit fatty acid transport protein